jgi:hypothetical protein
VHDGVIKSQKSFVLGRLTSFRRRPESSISRELQQTWTPFFNGVTTFYEQIKISESVKVRKRRIGSFFVIPRHNYVPGNPIIIRSCNKPALNPSLVFLMEKFHVDSGHWSCGVSIEKCRDGCNPDPPGLLLNPPFTCLMEK